jgi:hypothetical protein
MGAARPPPPPPPPHLYGDVMQSVFQHCGPVGRANLRGAGAVPPVPPVGPLSGAHSRPATSMHKAWSGAVKLKAAISFEADRHGDGDTLRVLVSLGSIGALALRTPLDVRLPRAPPNSGYRLVPCQFVEVVYARVGSGTRAIGITVVEINTGHLRVFVARAPDANTRNARYLWTGIDTFGPASPGVKASISVDTTLRAIGLGKNADRQATSSQLVQARDVVIPLLLWAAPQLHIYFPFADSSDDDVDISDFHDINDFMSADDMADMLADQ